LSPPDPTYWPSHSNRAPDIIHTLPNHINYNIANLADLLSDHTPVLLTLNNQLVSLKILPTLTPGKTVWKKFSHIVENNISLNISLKSTKEIDSVVSTLTTLIKNAVLDSSTSLPSNPNKNVFPEHFSKLLVEKRRAGNFWHHTHLPSDKSRYTLHAPLKTFYTFTIQKRTNNIYTL